MMQYTMLWYHFLFYPSNSITLRCIWFSWLLECIVKLQWHYDIWALAYWQSLQIPGMASMIHVYVLVGQAVVQMIWFFPLCHLVVGWGVSLGWGGWGFWWSTKRINFHRFFMSTFNSLIECKVRSVIVSFVFLNQTHSLGEGVWATFSDQTFNNMPVPETLHVIPK